MMQRQPVLQLTVYCQVYRWTTGELLRSQSVTIALWWWAAVYNRGRVASSSFIVNIRQNVGQTEIKSTPQINQIFSGSSYRDVCSVFSPVLVQITYLVIKLVDVKNSVKQRMCVTVSCTIQVFHVQAYWEFVFKCFHVSQFVLSTVKFSSVYRFLLRWFYPS